MSYNSLRKYSKIKSPLLNPWFITGFADGESCFHIGVINEKEYKTGWKVDLAFSIPLHKRDKDVLIQVRDSLGVGKIYKHGPNTVQLRVRSINDLKIIIEHFSKYPGPLARESAPGGNYKETSRLYFI